MEQVTLEDYGIDLPPPVENVTLGEKLLTSRNSLPYDAIYLHLRSLQRLWPFFENTASLEEKLAVQALFLDFVRHISQK